MILAGRGGKETIDIAQVLVQAGANVDLANDVSIGQTPLILSVKSLADGYGEIDMLDFLISRGANVNARDSSGNTPIRLARSGKLATYPLRRSEYVALIERLKRAGAKD
jgi:ankyrin repeat protein